MNKAPKEAARSVRARAAEQRRRLVRRMVEQDPRVTSAQVAAAVGCSPMTAWRDMQAARP